MLLTYEVGDDPLLPAQKDHFDARVLGAHQVRGDLGRGQSQDSFPVDLAQNVGNLVCPASYDLGEDLRVVLLSVTEGEDKPLKYPPIFQSAGVAVISKMDIATACDYDRKAALANLHRLAPTARVFETSAKTGQGMDVWCDFLIQQHKALKTRDSLSA